MRLEQIFEAFPQVTSVDLEVAALTSVARYKWGVIASVRGIGDDEISAEGSANSIDLAISRALQALHDAIWNKLDALEDRDCGYSRWKRERDEAIREDLHRGVEEDDK